MKIIYYRQRVEKKVPSQGETQTFLEQPLHIMQLSKPQCLVVIFTKENNCCDSLMLPKSCQTESPP